MPRGRPPAPRSIVNINEVLTASQIIQENYTITLLAQSMPNTITLLAQSMPNTWEAIQWCARRRLIQNLHTVYVIAAMLIYCSYTPYLFVMNYF